MLAPLTRWESILLDALKPKPKAPKALKPDGSRIDPELYRDMQAVRIGAIKRHNARLR